MNEIQRQILHLAQIYKDKPNEFILVLEYSLQIKKFGEQRSDEFLKIGTLLYQNSYFLLSLHVWKQALDYFVRYGDKETKSICYGNIGNAYGSLSQYQEAIEYQKKALEIMQDIGNQEGEINSYVNMSLAHHYLGQYEEAIKCQKKLLYIMQDIGNQEGEINSYMSLGNAYNSMSQYQKAIEYQKKALEIAKEIGDGKGESTCYGNIGNAYGSLSQYQKAIEYQKKALEIAKEIGDKEGESMCYVNLGIEYHSLSQYQKAIEYQKKALEIAKEIGDKRVESRCHMGLGNAYNSLFQHKKAITHHESALEIAKEIGDKEGESMCYGNIGNEYYFLSQHQKAIEYHEKSLIIKKEIGDKEGESACYVNLGAIYGSQGQYQKTIGCQESALEIAKEIGDKEGESACYGNIGNVFQSRGQYQEAIEYQKKALEIAKEIGDKEGESACYVNLGAIYYVQDKFQNTYDNLAKSINLNEEIGKDLAVEEHKISRYGKSANQYALMIQTCINLKNNVEAFEYVEKSKSKAFIDLMSTSNIRPSVEITDELSLLMEQEKRLLIQKTNIQRGDQNSSSHYDEIIKNLGNIYDKMSRIDSKYVSLRRPKTLSINEIQKKIPRNSILVEYFVARDKIFVFALTSYEIYQPKIIQITKENIQIHLNSFRNEIEFCLQEMKKTGKLSRDITNINNIMTKLGQLLLDPIYEYIDGKEDIFFVPHDLLHYIPFHALYREKRYLIEDHPIQYLPSASMLQFADDERAHFETCAAFGAEFNEEAEEIAKIFGTESFNDATKKMVLGNLDKDVLHFSCHGIFGNNFTRETQEYLIQQKKMDGFIESEPLNSAIILQDSIMTARELFDIRINANLVTLSACETGINDTKPGDELIGLTRSLLYAGASSVAVSLWIVNSIATKSMMKEFYLQLLDRKNKKTVSKSIQIAQLKIKNNELRNKDDLQDYSHPYFWAPFVLVGRP